ncbi:acyl carrier protein [Microcoleus vaginatus]|jgi:acyl carrier protein|uniref:acyl carrier protein n=1 Tax=Microcoleus vaginatus TaxID=119532 RepID=UPI0016865FA3|nr:acyl carrier protein [Microcoleus sp. FACHB-84]MBD2008826.1 acyl carrier protein [Microcoleus sp. FACHB-45]
MQSEQLIQKVISIIAENQYIPQEEISLESEFEKLGIDSLAALGIIGEIENEFNIIIPNDKAFLITNVRQLVESLEEFLSTATTHTS